MPKLPFDALPDSSRLWIFPADRPLSVAEQEALMRSAEEGLDDWSAHGSPVTWGCRIERGQVLVIGVDETRTALTGCSIDGAIRQIRDLESRFKTSLLDHGRVFFRDGERMRAVSRPEFKKLVAHGAIQDDTLVYNNVIATVGELRNGGWEIPYRSSWHSEAFSAKA